MVVNNSKLVKQATWNLGNSPFTIGNGDGNAWYGKVAVVRVYNRRIDTSRSVPELQFTQD